MATQRVPVVSGDPEPDWIPPPWNAARPEEITPPAAVQARRQAWGRNRERADRADRADQADRTVLGLALVSGLTGLVASGFLVVGPLAGTTSLPLGLLVIIGGQIAGHVLTRGEATWPLSKALLVGVVTTAGVLPLLALQVTLAREPYVAVSRHSATPAIFAAAAGALLLLVTAVWIAITFWSAPDEAALVFMPVALLVPVLIGLQAAIHHRTALQALAEASLLAAGGAVLAWLLPKGKRPLVPPVALAVQFLALSITGHGPSFQPTSGGIVPALYALILGLTVVLVVAVPTIAIGLRRAAPA